MNRLSYRLASIVIWIMLSAIVYFQWDVLLEYVTGLVPGYGLATLIVALFFGGLLMLIVQEKLADWVAPVQHVVKKQSPQERRAEVEKKAVKAIKEGRPAAALRLYEEAAMWTSAIKVAREVNDIPALARISIQLGHYERAQTLYLNLQEYEGAARAAALQDDIDAARELYEKAATESSETLDQEAAFRDRAGDREAAGRLYEAVGDAKRAAECYQLIGESAKGRSLAEQARAHETYERKKQKGTREYLEHRETKRKVDLVNEAQRLIAIGDFFGAGENYRDAGELIEAGIAFERFQEWERAARAFEDAGLKDRAQLVRMNIKKEAELREDVPPPPPPPAPSSIAAAHFQPIARNDNIPAFIPAGAQLVHSPELQDKVASMVREGKFKEAGELARENNDWLMGAVFLERAGELAQAADLYRQIGKVDEAVSCLEQEGRPKEAALMALAAGRRDQVVKSYLQALEKEVDPDELGLMLGELLIEWKRPERALQLLRRKLAPRGIEEGNAALHYRFARSLEDKQAVAEAHTIYRAMIAAGAQSKDVVEREARLAQALEGAIPQSAQQPDAEPDEIDKVLDDAMEPSGPWPLAAPEEGELKTFAFSPPEHFKGNFSAALDDEATSLQQMGGEMSLFGDPDPEALAVPAVHGDEWNSLTSVDESGEASATATAPVADEDPFRVTQRYVRKGEIARGGMGVIYEAEDTVLGRSVALKLILGYNASPDELQQFLLEARAIARLSHPNVVTIFDIGLMEFRHYIAMEMVRGGSLRDLIVKRKKLPLKEALRIGIGIAKALQASHEAGIVHRDIKPGNILFTEKGEVKIVDFGLAKMSHQSGDEEEVDIYKSAGTPGYMAPEQIRGEELLPRCDIYALGATLFYMLVGVPPYKIANKKDAQDIIDFQLAGELPQLCNSCEEVPEAIEQLYEYCTAVDPEGRYQSINDFLPTMQQWCDSLK